MTIRPKYPQNKPELTAERLRELLHYDPGTGVFTWKSTLSNRRGRGKKAGWIKDGYILISIDTATYRAHRLAWLYVYSEWPTKGIDHINCIRCDNRISNLREATQAENMGNRSCKNSNNTSGHAGVSNVGQKWRARIKVNGKDISCGRFTNKADAIATRRTAELEHFGEFAPRHDAASDE